MALDPELSARLTRNDDGLFAAIAQERGTGTVLMMAWMDDTALERTLESRRATYYSRSRQQYWVKGETSGHSLSVQEVLLDCDGFVGGLTTSGLGATDVGNKDAIGGLSRGFYRRLRAHYERPEAWTWQRDEGEQRPMDDAMQNWIAQADRTTRPAWQHGAAAGAQVSTTLRFTRDGVVRAVLRLGPAGAQLTRGGKTVFLSSANLPSDRRAMANVVADLRRALRRSCSGSSLSCSCCSWSLDLPSPKKSRAELSDERPASGRSFFNCEVEDKCRQN